eukprot:2625311-Pleurochrysis_carterae.AAC.2
MSLASSELASIGRHFFCCCLLVAYGLSHSALPFAFKVVPSDSLVGNRFVSTCGGRPLIA